MDVTTNVISQTQSINRPTHMLGAIAAHAIDAVQLTLAARTAAGVLVKWCLRVDSGDGSLCMQKDGSAYANVKFE